jgi:hypothetical protein
VTRGLLRGLASTTEAISHSLETKLELEDKLREKSPGDLCEVDDFYLEPMELGRNELVVVHALHVQAVFS